jgi:hypothetical protein
MHSFRTKHLADQANQAVRRDGRNGGYQIAFGARLSKMLQAF